MEDDYETNQQTSVFNVRAAQTVLILLINVNSFYILNDCTFHEVQT